MARAKSTTKKKTTKKTPESKKGGLAKVRATVKNAFKHDDYEEDLDYTSLQSSLPHLPTGSLVVDFLIGGRLNSYGVAPCPGLPKGRIMQLYGHESSGKTTLALTAAATTIANGGEVLYVDWEHEVSPTYAASLGVPIGDRDHFMLCQPTTMEEGLALIYTAAKEGVDLVIIDSIGACVPKSELEKGPEDQGSVGRIGKLAQIWSAFLPRLKPLCKRTGTHVLAISQIREKISLGGYGDTTNVQGGRAWKFYSAIRMKLQKIKTEKAKQLNPLTHKVEDQVVGQIVRARLEKNKVSDSQGHDQQFYLRWGKGIDDVRSVIEMAISYGIVKKGGAWLTWELPDGDTIKTQGMDKFRAELESRDGSFQSLFSQILPILSGDGVPTAVPDEDEKFDDDFISELAGSSAED
jgi:recombination protein RecA